MDERLYLVLTLHFYYSLHHYKYCLPRNLYFVVQLNIYFVTYKQVESEKHIKREHDILANNPHPNIVQYLGMYRTDKTTWLVMELCMTDLRSLSDQRKLSDLEAAVIIWQVLKALHHLHKEHIMHRFSEL